MVLRWHPEVALDQAQEWSAGGYEVYRCTLECARTCQLNEEGEYDLGPEGMEDFCDCRLRVSLLGLS